MEFTEREELRVVPRKMATLAEVVLKKRCPETGYESWTMGQFKKEKMADARRSVWRWEAAMWDEEDEVKTELMLMEMMMKERETGRGKGEDKQGRRRRGRANFHSRVPVEVTRSG